MKRKILTLLLLSIIFCTSMAQIPGYMGKRFSVGYSNYFFPAVIGPKLNATSKSDGMGFNTTHCFNLEYTIKARTNFCISYQLQNLGIKTNRYYYQTINDGFSTATVTYEYAPKPYSNMKLKTNSIGLGFKFYSKGTLAPVGKYKKIELLLLFSNLTYPKNSFYTDYYSQPTYTSIGNGNYNFSTFAITYTMGKSRVLFDKIVLDYGLRIGALPAGFIAFLNYDGNFFTDAPNSYEKMFRQDSNMRLLRQQVINAHIGISFLAF